jgi:hypothetical protein
MERGSEFGVNEITMEIRNMRFLCHLAIWRVVSTNAKEGTKKPSVILLHCMERFVRSRTTSVCVIPKARILCLQWLGGKEMKGDVTSHQPQQPFGSRS